MKLPFIRSLTAPMLALLAASCASDPNPFDMPAPPHQEDTQAFIKLSFNVADSKETRAGEELVSTDAEKIIKKVSLYIFDDQGKLEQSETSLTVSGNSLQSKISLTSPGVKTLFAIAYDAEIDLQPTTTSMNLADFKKLTFSSSMDQIARENGFAMTGESPEINMVKGDNDISMTMTRVAAKTQVMAASGLKLGDKVDDITFSNLEYKVLQQSTKMSLCGEVAFSTEGSPSNGTYPNLTSAKNDTHNYIAGVDAFSKDGCAYIAENPFSADVTGKNTFLSIKMKAKPSKVYGEDGVTERSFTDNDGNFYAVGKTNAESAVTSYAMGANKKVILFGSQNDADNYCKNSGLDASGYGVITFTGGTVYYRVNIKHGNEYKVLRNTFYKVKLNQINALGQCAEVIPTNADTKIEITESKLGVTFSVADWLGQDVDVTLE